MHDAPFRKKMKHEELIGTNRLEITSPVFFYDIKHSHLN